MNWPDDDRYEGKKEKKNPRKPRRPFIRTGENGDADEHDDGYYKRKRASKRSHRPKTSNDDFWERNRQ